MTTPANDASVDASTVSRRTFLAGSVAAGAAAGLEGIQDAVKWAADELKKIYG
jgi:TAT (twin-arginine translocation) pathway-exported protein